LGHVRGKAGRAPLIAVLGLELVALACSNDPGKAHAGAPPGMPVKIQEIQAVPVSDTTEYVATLKSRDSAVIMPEVEGRIVQIYVHSGEHVQPGAHLMQIDPSKQEATVNSQASSQAAQEANLQYLNEQYKRTSGLYSAGVVSKQDLDQAKSALDNAEAQLKALDAQLAEQQVQLHYYTVIATRAGIVGDIPVHVGDRVSTTTWLTTVDQPGSLEAYVYVPIERASQLKMGLPVQIVDSNDKAIADSRITFISPQVDTTTQTILVKAEIANHQDRLRNAQFIRAKIVWGTQKEPLVPVLAVSRVGGQYFAFFAEQQNGKLVARQKPLRVGDMVGNDYVVLEGAKPGDKIIVSGTQFLVDGVPVFPQG
jgi:RND family efflux transporter MFP subunit